MREHLYLRDLGVCHSCNVDTRLSKIELENCEREVRRKNDSVSIGILGRCLASLGITVKESRKSLWHADHVNPVMFGGGTSGLDNLQTLCVKCHKLKTKTQRKPK
jgi:5-methylcytosine-specific restriction endonuclease McrA